MQATTFGGLNGKARTLRLRNRASRIYTQHLLDEYNDPDDSPRERERYIPIRNRNEFLPAVSTWCEQPEADGVIGMQLELPLETMSRDKMLDCDAGEQSEAVLSFDADKIDAKPVSTSQEAKPLRTIEKVSLGWARPKASFQPMGRRNADSEFHMNRFLYGCLLGGAAAAVFLLVVSVVVD